MCYEYVAFTFSISQMNTILKKSYRVCGSHDRHQIVEAIYLNLILLDYEECKVTTIMIRSFFPLLRRTSVEPTGVRSITERDLLLVDADYDDKWLNECYRTEFMVINVSSNIVTSS